MNISKLDSLELSSLSKKIEGDEKAAFLAALEPYLIANGKGRSIPDGIYSFINTEVGDTFLNQNGYGRCFATGSYSRKDKMQPVFRSYGHFKKDVPQYMLSDYFEKSKRNGDIVFDEILKVNFYDRAQEVIKEDFSIVTCASSHVSYLADNGEMFLSQVARRKKVYSTFKTNFYGYGRAPKDWPVPEGDTLGIEIEMLFESLPKKLEFSSWVGNNFPGWVCEYDGSLEDYGNAGDCGLELISPPLVYEDMQNQASQICRKAVELGGKGFQAGIFYGMHVTIQVPRAGRSGPSRQTMASRYIAFMNLPVLRPFWQLVARRKGESFSTYSPFKDVSIETCLTSERGERDNHPHRRAVFVRNPTLLETRIFRSNLSEIQVRANIEICKIVMDYCKSSDFSMENIKHFWDYLHANMSKDLRACLYRKKNTPIKVLNEIVMNSELESEPENQALYL